MQLEPIVLLPFHSKAFKDSWEYYKKYYLEEFGISIDKTTEIRMLEEIEEYSGENEKTALDLINFLVLNGCREINKPTPEQLRGDIPYE
ncbi:MAG TPA: hypothetical protein PK978_05545 [Paludibacter sp.]|nr:hypothetical protein [Paludibacter sp.]